MLGINPPSLAAHRYFRSIDVDETREKVSKVYCSHRLDPIGGTGRLDAWQNSVALDRISVGMMSYGADVEIDPGCLEDFYLLMLPVAGSATITSEGNSFRADRATATLLNPTDPVRMVWDQACTKAMVRIERDALEQQLAILLDKPIRAPVRFATTMPMEGTVAIWWQYVAALMGELDRATPARATTRQLEALLLTNLLETQPHNYSEALQRGGCAIAPRHVRLVERYIEEHADEPIDMARLVAVSGVSSRTLFEGFQRFRDISPMAYLRLTRLRRVHEELTSAPLPLGVADVASRWGFYELGRFAGQYRSLFGETPSETLRRRAS
ncbi:AraC family transcriptional regulator [Rhizorhabdus phycosphaerae]|uniref:AraC family transcriptional regulator n=1 Tax=Rhizorhabdus phycosphaerae TaxID=2711156 RepID=UPI0013EB9C9B|nr:AraC family transcriptional regulator [Rhizorhabdus phycosphaerae]